MSRDGSDRPRKAGRKVRVDFRKNREKPARDKGEWTRAVKQGREEVDDAHKVENIRAKGELSRKRTVIIGGETAEQATWLDGVVTAIRGLVTEVDTGEQLFACTARRILRTRQIDERTAIAVGDRVRISRVEQGGEEQLTTSERRELPEGVVEEVHPRKTILTRTYERKTHIIAANIDTAVIVMAADQPTLRPHLIDRYLVAAHKGDMRPIIVINKADLDETGFAGEVIERYRALGYRAIMSCVDDGRGIDELRDIIRNETSVFTGPSGVGKSSILNAIQPGFALKIGTLTDMARGKHTTTTAVLLKWDFGGYVIDTPGIRQFELAHVESAEVEAFFKEFIELIPACKFPDCTHRHETGCAITAAVEAGAIHPQRYDSYVRMFEERREKERTWD